MDEDLDLVNQYRAEARACCEDCVRVAGRRIANDPDWVRQTQELVNRVTDLDSQLSASRARVAELERALSTEEEDSDKYVSDLFNTVLYLKTRLAKVTARTETAERERDELREKYSEDFLALNREKNAAERECNEAIRERNELRARVASMEETEGLAWDSAIDHHEASITDLRRERDAAVARAEEAISEAAHDINSVLLGFDLKSGLAASIVGIRERLLARLPSPDRSDAGGKEPEHGS